MYRVALCKLEVELKSAFANLEKVAFLQQYFSWIYWKLPLCIFKFKKKVLNFNSKFYLNFLSR